MCWEAEVCPDQAPYRESMKGNGSEAAHILPTLYLPTVIVPLYPLNNMLDGLKRRSGRGKSTHRIKLLVRALSYV